MRSDPREPRLEPQPRAKLLDDDSGGAGALKRCALARGEGRAGDQGGDRGTPTDETLNQAKSLQIGLIQVQNDDVAVALLEGVEELKRPADDVARPRRQFAIVQKTSYDSNDQLAKKIHHRPPARGCR